MSASALLVADATPEDGLGHVSRLSAVAVALRSRGIETDCLANGRSDPLARDGVMWTPWSPGGGLPSEVGVAIIDSYRLKPEAVVEANVPVVTFRDHGDARAASALIVSVAGTPSDEPPKLSGPRYAALRPAYWGLPPREVSGPLQGILVTTGAGDPNGVGVAIARAVASRLSDVAVTLVRGPHAPALTVNGVRLLATPDSLIDQQLGADLVISGGGQTMLEAAACGTPCVSLVLAENQREQALRLAASGAVVLVEPPSADRVLAVIDDLDPSARQELSRRAQDTVDGYGALRIAYQVEALLARSLR
jgi:spore coat polysaccharide biosynthesis predicted glycosyltransferase SpsG